MMSFQFEATGDYSEGAYWGRQFPAWSAEAAGRERQAMHRQRCPLGIFFFFFFFYSLNHADRVFALVNLGHGWEFGDVLISELKTLRVLGLPIERDRLFKGDRPLSAYAMEELQ